MVALCLQAVNTVRPRARPRLMSTKHRDKAKAGTSQIKLSVQHPKSRFLCSANGSSRRSKVTFASDILLKIESARERLAQFIESETLKTVSQIMSVSVFSL
jgi:selenocysteine lyase/cysteine desulfurase